MEQRHKGTLVYVGTYNRGESDGIYIYRMDPSSGALTPVDAVAGLSNPSFLDIHPNGRYLYAVNEVGGNGGLSALALDPGTGALTLLNQQSVRGDGPCYVSVDATGRYALVANYSSGSVAMLPIAEDGQLKPASDFVQHEGSGPDPQRQEGPHAHAIMPDPTNRYAFAPDLGLDKVMIYRLDLENGKLLPNEQPWASVPPGAGPRHIAFHPNARYAYVINELDSTMTTFAYDAARGTLRALQTISILPEGYTEASYAADVHVSASGRFVYGSNRGHDSIAILAVDEATGTLTPIDYESTRGNFPRNFAIDPTGTIMLVANQNSNNIVAYRIDPQTGRLTPTGQETNVRMPVCIKMLPTA